MKNNLPTSNSTSTTSPSANKKSQSPFQQIITNSIAKIKQFYPQQQLHEFNQIINQLPKKVKQLNIDPYLFLLEYLFNKEELRFFGIKQLNVIIDENYYSKANLNMIAKFLEKSVEKHSSEVVNIVMKIKQPNLRIFQLYFQIYSTVLLPQDVAMRYRNLGYVWLIRIFEMKQTKIPLYFKSIIDKIGIFEVPQLITHQEQQRHLKTYIHKVLNNILNKVQDRLDIQMGQQAMVVRKQKKGKYLYCFMCQKPADYYCKDTKVPVCGSQCKKDHLLYISQVHAVNQRFTQDFKSQIQKLLFKNYYIKRSPSLSVDFLAAIYIFSSYIPKQQIQHSKIIKSPIMIEKVWLLYASYYQKKGQLFEHIFISFLNSQNQYMQQIARFYFLEISSSHRILQIYYNLDFKGTLRIFPIILQQMIKDKDYSEVFVTNLIEAIFQNINSIVNHPSGSMIFSNQLLQIFNQRQNPIQQLKSYFPNLQNYPTQSQISWFLLKNQQGLNKNKFTRILDKDENFIKSFLQAVTQKRKFCTVDEVLRQIFYFINVNVSQKIYRLLELLYDVYDWENLGNSQQRKAFKKDDSLFQYMYLIIMINTQLHNPNLQKKPTLSQVLERISHINKNLSTQYAWLIQNMFQRLKAMPFSQQSRGVLQCYQKFYFRPIKVDQFYLPLVILQNYELIFQTISSVTIPNKVLYRICNILIAVPEVCSLFFKILLERLQRLEVEDEYILQAIRNIIQQQPNSVGIENGWRLIFNFIKQNDKSRKKMSKNTISSNSNSQSTKSISLPSQNSIYQSSDVANKKRRKIFQPFALNRSSSQKNSDMIWLDLQSIIVSSPQLKHDNFIYFFKDFVNTFPMDAYFKDYQRIIFFNRKRLNLMANSLMLSYRKIQNLWIGLSMIQFISNLQDTELEIENQESKSSKQINLTNSKSNNISSMLQMKSQIILLMLKQTQINQNNEYLLLQCIISLTNSQNFRLTSQLWQCITHLVLKFSSQENQSIVQDLMRRYQSCEEYYESLMIQKTLNSTQPQLINKDVLTKLQKLEPYIHDLSDKILQMFILKDNLSVIEKNLEKFIEFQETFKLFEQNYDSIKNIVQVKSFIINKIQLLKENNVYLSSILNQAFLGFLSKILQKQKLQELDLELINVYSKYLIHCISQKSFQQKVVLDRSIIFYQSSKQIYRLSLLFYSKDIHNPQLKPIFQSIISQCQNFNKNINYRKILSQTYTFKNIVSHQQKQIHSNYVISLFKQYVQSKKVVWGIVKNDKNQIVEFIVKEIQALIGDYSQISTNLNQLNRNPQQSFDHKIIEQKYLILRQSIKLFRIKFQFLLSVMAQFQEQKLMNQKNDQQSQKKQDLEKQTLLSKLQKLKHQIFRKILFNGIFVIKYYSNNSHNPSQNQKKNESNDKKHKIHMNYGFEKQPFSQYLQKCESLKDQNEMKNIQKLMQIII